MNKTPSQLPVELLRRIDSACDRFEEAWRAGLSPRLDEYLCQLRPDERPALFAALQSLQHELLIADSELSGLDGIAATQPMPTIHEVVETVDATPTSPKVDATRSHDNELPCVTFRVIAGPHAGAEFSFHEHDTLFAGRLRSARLRLQEDSHFSRHHFRLEVNPPTCYLMDLGSKHGTFVNGKKIREKFLRHGDVISGGKTKILVGIFLPEEPNPPVQSPINSVAATPSDREITSDAKSKKVGSSDKALFDSINGYQILEKTGDGDLGIVYKAKKLSTLEVCALKVLAPTSHYDSNAIQTFLREASVLNQLVHPHIIRMIEMGASERRIFIATEFVKSIAWEQIVQRSSTAKRIRIACSLMDQILDALEYAHARSLVHRDIKPGNILIGKKDDRFIAKLADFGLAKQYTTAGLSNVTRDGDVLGSLPFMSPDQFLNSRDARPTCDLYSAGATLYWMLTGREPVVLEGHPCKFLAILEDPPTPIRELIPEISEPLAAVIHRSLAKVPEQRFASAAEMRHQLRSAFQQ